MFWMLFVRLSRSVLCLYAHCFKYVQSIIDSLLRCRILPLGEDCCHESDNM